MPALLTCPHCGLPAMSAVAKLTLGPAASRRCARCGLAVGVAPLRACMAFTPSLVVVALVLLRVLHEPLSMIAAGLLGIVATFALHLSWVPLVPRQLTRSDAVDRARAASRSAKWPEP